MEPAGLATLAVVAGVVLLLAATRISPDLVLLGGLLVLTLGEVLTPEAALVGFSNPGMLTVGALFVVAAGVRDTGALAGVLRWLFGRSRSVTRSMIRIIFPVAGLSAFLNNTPVVAMLLPEIVQWTRTRGWSAAKFLIPVSYASILGGMCTLIGSSTNLIVHGMLVEAGLGSGDRFGLGMFELAWVGVPCALVGLIYLAVAHRWLLPARSPALDADNPRRYLTSVQVTATGPVAGRTLDEAELWQRSDLVVSEVMRDGRPIPATRPDLVLLAGDRLDVVGDVDSMLGVRSMRGLQRADTPTPGPEAAHEVVLAEAVVSSVNPLLGAELGAGRFRQTYDAAIVAISRGAERMAGDRSEIRLREGDTLLIETHRARLDALQRSRGFYLVSQLDRESPPVGRKAWLGLAILVGMVVMAATQWLTMLEASATAAAALLATRCIESERARRAIEYRVLLAIAAALGLGTALTVTGAAHGVAEVLLSLTGDSPLAALAGVFAVTVLFTELVTNNAAAVLMLPIALDTAATLDAGPMPFAIAVVIGASTSFATPIGYQTNLMVYAPGGYRFLDYARLGVPLAALVGIVTVLVAPLVWPL